MITVLEMSYGIPFPPDHSHTDPIGSAAHVNPGLLSHQWSKGFAWLCLRTEVLRYSSSTMYNKVWLPRRASFVGRIYGFLLSYSVVIGLSFSPFSSLLGQWCLPSGRKCHLLAKIKAPNLFTLEHRAIAGRESLLRVWFSDLFNRL